MTGTWSWAALALLGAYHGVDPAMGWLFATALGLQRRRAIAVLSALPPIALGHGLAVALVAGLLGGARAVLDARTLRVPAATLLILLGVTRLLRGRLGARLAGRPRLRRMLAGHPGWTGMRVGAGDLVAWSFLTSTAHGAPLMLVPLLLGALGSHVGPGAGADLGLAVAATATVVHTAAMLAAAGTVALAAYRLGLGLLRRAWLNTDAVWAGALVAAGVLTLLT